MAQLPQRSAAFLAKRAALRAWQREQLGLDPLPVPPEPEPLPPPGLVLGCDADTSRTVVLGDIERRQGLYILGKQGTGKSSFLEEAIISDIERGQCVVVLDPHRDLINHIVRRISPNREEDVALFDINDVQFPIGINLLHCDDPDDVDRFTDTMEQVYHVFERLFGPSGELPSWSTQMEQVLRACLHVLIKHRTMTLADIPALFDHDAFRRRLVRVLDGPDDTEVRAFFAHYDRMKPEARERYVGAARRRLARFLQQPIVRAIVGQSEPKFDIGRLMAERKIVLIQLHARKRQVTALVGSLLIGLIYAAALDRPELQRTQVNLYADEFAFFDTPEFADIIVNTRKFGIATTLAHQGRWQLKNTSNPTFNATIGMGSYVIFQVQRRDAVELSEEFDLGHKPPPQMFVMDPYHYIETHGHKSRRAQEAFAALTTVLLRLQSAWERSFRVESHNERVLARQGYQPHTPTSPRAKQHELRELVRQYLFHAMQGKDRPELLEQAWMVYGDYQPAFEAAVIELGQSLRESPVTVDEPGSRPPTTREVLTQLRRFEAYAKVLLPDGVVEHRLRTAPYRFPDNDPETLARVARIVAHSRDRYALRRADVEAEIQRRQDQAPRATTLDVADGPAALDAPAGQPLLPTGDKPDNDPSRGNNASHPRTKRRISEQEEE